MTKIFLLIILPFSVNICRSQTIECNKIAFYPANHIRNPSLEKTGGSCPDGMSTDIDPTTIEMNSIIQYWRSPILNYSSIEYFGRCNNFSNVLPWVGVPQPIPDGESVIGFQLQRTKSGDPNSEIELFKEYICTNLLRVLKKDTLYRLNFAVGFGKRKDGGSENLYSDSPVKFSIFGMKDSTKIPAARNSQTRIFGCLVQQLPEWIELGSVVIRGDPGTWQRGIIDFVAPASIETIALGSACDLHDVSITSRDQDIMLNYYFIDDLKFFQASAPKPRLSKTGGSSCSGDSTTLRLQSNDFYNGSAFQWYKDNVALPENKVSLTVSSSTYGPGWYKMRVQNDSVCMMTDSVYLEWAPRITDPFSGRPDTTLCVGETVELKIDGGTSATYLWNTGSTASSITVATTGTYTVRVSNACNALNILRTVVYRDCPPTVFVPTAFTPNGDGLNDVFRANATGRMKSFNLSVYDRFGQRIFVSTDPAKGWDGKTKNKSPIAGVYTWRLEYIDASDKTVMRKGTVTLIR